MPDDTPPCAHEHNGGTVVETRKYAGRVYRRRRCPDCRETWITEERLCPSGWPRELVREMAARLPSRKPRTSAPVTRARTADEIMGGVWTRPTNVKD